MLALKVLKSYPQQRKALLFAIGRVDVSNSSLIAFNVDKASL